MNSRPSGPSVHLNSLKRLTDYLRASQVITIGILLFGLLIASPSHAQETSVTHTVEQGETLFSIAQQYEVTIDEIKKWNDLTSNVLETGQKLQIRPSQQPQRKPDTEAPASKAQKESDESSSTSYVVKSGDTLYEIAQKHDMSVKQLKAINDLTSNDISVGQRLLVRQPTSTTPSVAQRTTESAPQGQFMRYEVGRNENWSDITQQFQMDSVELAGLNPETTPSDLFEGKKVTVLKPPKVINRNPYRIDAQLKRIGTQSVIQYEKEQRATPTSSGELYNPEALTAAHPSISLGSIIYIVNQENQRGVYVKVNDRTDQNVIKLSNKAYEVLNFVGPEPRVQIFKRP